MNGYVITNKDKTVWLCVDKSNAYSLTTDKDKAIIFDSKPAADAIFRNNLSKLIKSKGVEVRSVTLKMAGSDTAPKKELVETPSAPIEVGSSKHIISIIADAVAKLNGRYQMLIEQQSKYDRQMTDIEHYIEFNAGKLNACDGYKAYKLLQDVLLDRRKVKDELQIIDVVRGRMESEDIANIEGKVKELESRTYEPRELIYLFERE